MFTAICQYVESSRCAAPVQIPLDADVFLSEDTGGATVRVIWPMESDEWDGEKGEPA